MRGHRRKQVPQEGPALYTLLGYQEMAAWDQMECAQAALWADCLMIRSDQAKQLQHRPGQTSTAGHQPLTWQYATNLTQLAIIPADRQQPVLRQSWAHCSSKAEP